MANYTNLRVEPPDQAIGRSRRGLSTKIYHLCDGLGRPLVLLVGPGQGGDSPMFLPLLASLQVPRIGPGRPRTRPVKVLADKAYSIARQPHCAMRTRDNRAVIAEPSDPRANRKRRGRHGGRPPIVDSDAYRDRNVAERSFNAIKQWRGLAIRCDKLALTYRGGVVLAAILTWLRALGDAP